MEWWQIAVATMTIAGLTGCADADPANPVFVNGTAASGVVDGDGTRLALARNGNLITLTGKVVSTAANSFLLDYGSGRVTVEMDDWDWFQEGRSLKAGDGVTVSGRVDKDLLEAKKIEASTVYVQNLGTQFYANASDEEDFAPTTIYVTQAAMLPAAAGQITAIEGREFVLGSGGGALRVDTAGMTDNPLDKTGSPQLKIGDEVQVWGALDIDAHEQPEIAARGIVLRNRDRTKKADSADATD